MTSIYALIRIIRLPRLHDSPTVNVACSSSSEFDSDCRADRALFFDDLLPFGILVEVCQFKDVIRPAPG